MKVTFNVSELCEDMFLTKQGSKPLHQYYSTVKGRWKELSLYQPFLANITTWKKQ